MDEKNDLFIWLLIIITLLSTFCIYEIYIYPPITDIGDIPLGLLAGALMGVYPMFFALAYIIIFISEFLSEVSLDEYKEIEKIHNETKYEAVKNLIKEMLKKEKITGRDYLKIKKLESLCINKEKEEIWLLERKEKKQKERSDIDNIKNRLQIISKSCN